MPSSYRPWLDDPDHSSGLLSMAFLAKRVVSRSLQPIPEKGKYGLYWRHLKNLLGESHEVFMVLPKWSRERFLQGGRPGLVRSHVNVQSAHDVSFQVPCRSVSPISHSG